MEFAKAYNFLKKYKTVIFLPIISVCLFLACFFYEFWIVATIFSIILLTISDFSEILYYTLFFQMFSTCGDFSVINTFTAAGLICAKYIYGLVKKTEKFYVMPFTLTVIICIFFSAITKKIDIHGVYQGSSLIVALFLIYLIFVYRDKIKIGKCADFLISGILVSAAISFLSLLFEDVSFNIFDGINNFKRLKLLTENENSLSIYCSLSLSYYVSCLTSGKGKIIKNIIFSIIAICFGLATLSKCFLVILIFIILYLFFMLIYTKKLKSIYYIVPAILILAILSLIFKSNINTTFGRFFSKFSDLSFLSAFTTGRSDLWTIYINEITSSMRNMLIGVGMFNERLVDIGPHNLLIHLIYRMGLIGIIMIGILIYYYYRDSNKTLKLTLKNCLPVLVFIMISFIESFL